MSNDRLENIPSNLEDALKPLNPTVGVVVSRYNESITNRLAEGTLEVCRELNIPEERITVYQAPGALEIPVLTSTMVKSGKFSVVIALGCIIQGETQHHEALATSIFPQLMVQSCYHGIPIGVGILTVKNQEQADARAGGSKGNKGREAVIAALETLTTQAAIRQNHV